MCAEDKVLKRFTITARFQLLTAALTEPHLEADGWDPYFLIPFLAEIVFAPILSESDG